MSMHLKHQESPSNLLGPGSERAASLPHSVVTITTDPYIGRSGTFRLQPSGCKIFGTPGPDGGFWPPTCVETIN